MGLILRVLIGYAIACLVAGLTTVLFAYPPAELAAMPGDTANDILISKTISTWVILAIFALPFSFLAIAFGERHRRHDWLYYALAGIVVALIGFAAQYISEDARQTWSVTNSTYPLISFITSGFLGGLAYWIASGRLAGPRGTKPLPHQGRPGGPDMRKPASPANRPNPQRT